MIADATSGLWWEGPSSAGTFRIEWSRMRKSLSLLLSLLGLFDSLYLLWVYTSPFRPLACVGNGCDAVRASAYARMGGLPVPLYGVVAYSALALLIFADAFASPAVARRMNQAVAAISGAGFLFSIYLSYLEAFVVRAWCFWCIVSALAISLLFVLALVDLSRPIPPAEPGPVVVRVGRQAGVALLALVVGIPAFYFLSRQRELPPARPPSAQTLRERLVRQDSHVTGNPQAEVTIVEFADFQCPACGQEEQVTEEVRARYGTQIRFIFRQFPLIHAHPWSEKAAEASECAAEQGKFWEAVRKFYTWQDDLRETALKNYAAQLGLDTNRFAECLESGSQAERVHRDWEDGVALGVRATPTFFVDSKMLIGFLPVERFAQLVDQELAARSLTTGKSTQLPPAAPDSP